MPYHSHTLNAVSHSHIIERIDPITGDSVQENDTVVFCANCKSCFLEESWVYMDETHCEQNETLDTAPTLPSKLIAKKREEKLIAELRDSNSSSIMIMLSFILVSIPMGILLNKITSLGSQIAMVCGFIVGSFASAAISTLTSSRKFKHITKQDKKDVRLFYTHIEIGKDSFSWNDIAQIKYQRVVSKKTHSEFSSLLVYFKSGQFFKTELPVNNSLEMRKFLIGFGQLPRFVEVFFYSEEEYEHRLLLEIQEKSNGKIEVGEIRE